MSIWFLYVDFYFYCVHIWKIQYIMCFPKWGNGSISYSCYLHCQCLVYWLLGSPCPSHRNNGFTSRTSEASGSEVRNKRFFRHKQTYFAPYICHIAICDENNGSVIDDKVHLWSSKMEADNGTLSLILLMILHSIIIFSVTNFYDSFRDGKRGDLKYKKTMIETTIYIYMCIYMYSIYIYVSKYKTHLQGMYIIHTDQVVYDMCQSDSLLYFILFLNLFSMDFFRVEVDTMVEVRSCAHLYLVDTGYCSYVRLISCVVSVRFPCKLQNTLSLEDLAEYLHSFTRLSVHDVFVLFTHVALAYCKSHFHLRMHMIASVKY